jgi:CubicO group peptidase (beta-lactamase class C family)
VAGAWFADGSTVTVAVGLADRDRGTPMTEGALLHAGSVGKTFFAALALELVGEGRLVLDETGLLEHLQVAARCRPAVLEACG